MTWATWTAASCSTDLSQKVPLATLRSLLGGFLTPQDGWGCRLSEPSRHALLLDEPTGIPGTGSARCLSSRDPPSGRENRKMARLCVANVASGSTQRWTGTRPHARCSIYPSGLVEKCANRMFEHDFMISPAPVGRFSTRSGDARLSRDRGTRDRLLVVAASSISFAYMSSNSVGFELIGTPEDRGRRRSSRRHS